jgi:TRAP-type C4-dicarboxylate transport system permease small subunit
MGRARVLVDRALAAALVVIMAVMVANVLWQVFTRFVLRSPSSYTEELARYLLIWVGLLGAAYTAGQRLHLAIDLFSMRVRPPTRARMELFIQACIALFALGVMVVGGIRLVYISFALEQISAALRISLGFVYMVVPLSGALILFYVVASILDPRAPAAPEPMGTVPPPGPMPPR